jgi:LmbE family N-acetylglucosaminyl deacetylase
MTRTAFAIAAHPDDIEFFMSGTLMLLKAAGYEIHYMNVADGCCGSTRHSRQEIARIRRAEAMEAAASIGAVFHESITPDLEVFYDKPNLAKVAALMREIAPEIVLTHPPADYMEDHTNVCRLAVTAAFVRGAPNFVTDPPRSAVAGKVRIYHCQPYGNCDPLYNPVTPSLFVDVSPLIERKVAMLACHRSQKDWLDESQGLGSYLEKMKELGREVGRMSGAFAYAEGFRPHLHMGFCGPSDDPLFDALGGSVLGAKEVEADRI